MQYPSDIEMEPFSVSGQKCIPQLCLDVNLTMTTDKDSL
jgi:hypothetical protein